MNRYFPVTAKYLVPGPLYRLGEPGAGERYLETDENIENYLRYKRSGAAQSGPSRTHPASAVAEQQVAHWLGNTIATELHAASPGEDIDAMVSRLQEDLVILCRDPHTASATAVYLNVAFPSGWCPRCALGKDFLAIHAPVPQSDGFDDAARERVTKFLFGRQTLVRFVWTVTPDNGLDRRMCAHDPRHTNADIGTWDAVEKPGDIHFRVERQIIAPINNAVCAFLIRVYQDPVISLDQEQRRRIAAALESMTPAVARYKGLLAHREKIGRLLVHSAQ